MRPEWNVIIVAAWQVSSGVIHHWLWRTTFDPVQRDRRLYLEEALA